MGDEYALDPVIAVHAASCWFTKLTALLGSEYGPNPLDQTEIECLMEWAVRSGETRAVRMTNQALAALMSVRSTFGVEPSLEYLRMAADVAVTHRLGQWQFVEDVRLGVEARWQIPLGSLSAMKSATVGAAGDTFPEPTVTGAPGHLRLDARLARGVADGHIHLTAALPFDGLMYLALKSTRSISTAGRNELDSEDSWGNQFNDAYVLAAARLSFRALVTFACGESRSNFVEYLKRDTRLPRAASGALASGRFWSQAFAASSGTQPTISEGIAEALGELGPLEEPTEFTRLSSHARLVAWKSMLFKTYFDTQDDREFGMTLANYLRCESLLHLSTTQSQAGLGTFLGHSDSLRAIRKSASVTKKDLVCAGMEYLQARGGLRLLELRTAEQPSSRDRQFGARGLATVLLQYLKGLSSYRKLSSELGRTPAEPVMPICLIKTKEVPYPRLSNHLWPSRFQFAGLLNLIDAYSRLSIDVPGFGEFFCGLDVAGDECAVPNWIFSICFGEYQRRTLGHVKSDGAFSAHAGESFDTPLSGLRHIGEALAFPVPAGTSIRIGHALALSGDIAFHEAPSTFVIDAEEMLDDLTWAVIRLEATKGGNDALMLRIRAEMLRLGEVVYGDEIDAGGPTVDQLVKAYQLRTDVACLTRIGLLQGGNAQSGLSMGAGVECGYLRDDDASLALLSRYLVGDRFVAGVRASIMFGFVREVFNAVLPIVLDEVRVTGALVECCPTSNLVIRGLGSYSEHPIFEFGDLGIGCTINTDDPAVFHSTIYDEYNNILAASITKTGSLDGSIAMLDGLRIRGMETVAVASQGRDTALKLGLVCKELQSRWA